MRICIAGAGAIGGFMGGRLATAGHDVTFITVGEDLDAIRADGLTIIAHDGSSQRLEDLCVTNDTRNAGPQDLVVLAVKAHQIGSIAGQLPALFGRDTVCLTVQNGLPWWYFQRHGGPFAGHRLESTDPDGLIARQIPAERIIGCVAYPAVERIAPGILKHVEGSRFPIGELDGSDTLRARRISRALVEAGFKSPILEDIRSEIWLKALGALAFNPISALTRATLQDICRCAETKHLATQMMREAEEVARRIGVTLRLSIERRLSGAEAVGAHKTSMLQDVERRQPLELDAILGSVIEVAGLTGLPTPNLDAVYACVALLDRVNCRYDTSDSRSAVDTLVRP